MRPVWSVSPSHRNMSQTRSTEAQGRVREKAHMNHSVMYRMGSSLCFLRWRWATGDTRRSRAYRISPSSWIASWWRQQGAAVRGDGRRSLGFNCFYRAAYYYTDSLNRNTFISILFLVDMKVYDLSETQFLLNQDRNFLFVTAFTPLQLLPSYS